MQTNEQKHFSFQGTHTYTQTALTKSKVQHKTLTHSYNYLLQLMSISVSYKETGKFMSLQIRTHTIKHTRTCFSFSQS